MTSSKVLQGRVYGVVRGELPRLELLGARFHKTPQAAVEYAAYSLEGVTDARIACFTVRYEGDYDETL